MQVLAGQDLAGLSLAGISVPDDISVIGHNETDFHRFCHPSIATIGFDKRTFASRAIGMLIQMINGEEWLEDRIQIPTYLVRRESA